MIDAPADPDAGRGLPAGRSIDEPPARIPRDWPNRVFSRSVRIGPLDWHVQVGGTGPALCLLHGSGSSAHSWADLFPALTRIATVVAPDLPGHGFTTGATTASLTLPRVALDLSRLLDALRIEGGCAVVGHSAGAALALRWALHAPGGPRAIMGFNPSLIPPSPLYTRVLGPLIAPIATSAVVTHALAALVARTRTVDRLLASTASTIPPAQRERYTQLFHDPAHVRGAMGLMAAADLPAIERDAPRLAIPLAFVVGMEDPWVPQRPLLAILRRACPGAAIDRWSGGHLLHEADPERATATIAAWLRTVTPGMARTADVR